MPVHELGYRGWQETAVRPGRAWLVIADTNIRLTWKNPWLRRLLLLAWMPAAYFGVGLFFFDRASHEPVARSVAVGLLRQLPNSQAARRAFSEDPDASRHEVWTLMLFTHFRYPQGVLMVFVVGLVVPPLVAQDVRSRAFLLYFSRPLGAAAYILGKSVTVWFYLSLVALLPALLLYVLAVGLSPSISVVLETWDLPLRILAASVVLMVPTTALALCFSSLTSESRYASFAWFAVWVLGAVAYSSLTMFDLNGAPPNRSDPLSRWTMLSLYHTLGRVQAWIFGYGADDVPVLGPAVVLLAVTVISLMVLWRRVWAPLRA